MTRPTFQTLLQQLISRVDRATSALLLIDLQPDFMAGGALACADAEDIMAPIAELMAADLFAYVIATQDWHPAQHTSFISQHPHHQPFDRIQLYGHEQILWPDHCVMDTPGAALHPAIDWRQASLIVRKGFDGDVDSYSAFRHNIDKRGNRCVTGLTGWLREVGVTDVYLCGLARDVCVLWSAQDAADAAFNVHFLWPLTRPVSYATDRETLISLAQKKITVWGRGIDE